MTSYQKKCQLGNDKAQFQYILHIYVTTEILWNDFYSISYLWHEVR